MTRRPNIVLIQADQLAAQALGAYGNSVVISPRLDRIADEGVVFDRAYCNSPLCAPSRASMMTGLLPSEIGAYDNGADFASSVPTFAHVLRGAGYRTALIGRMHFIGPDQLHGFEQRLTTDVYPAGLDMVPDWELPPAERLPWYHEASSVFSAGASVATVQRDFDDEVVFRTLRHLNDLARDPGDDPFLVVASFIHPHDPYEPPAEHWALYDDVEIDDPRVAPVDFDDLDPHSQRLQQMSGFDQKVPDVEETRRARRAYYASVSYVDENVGRILDRLDALGLREDTVVIVTSDHGDLLGERGLWYKMSPFEQSSRVPLIVHAPERFAARRVDAPVSLIDLLPTLADLAGADAPETSGRSLTEMLVGENTEPEDVVIEYLAEGVTAPHLTVVRGPYKFVRCPGDPDQLFDVAADPDELADLADDPAYREVADGLRAVLAERYDLDALRADVRRSQRRRQAVQRALSTGQPHAWDHAPAARGDDYVRGDFWAALEHGRLPAPENV
ncbi:MAG: choline-sulfatase [Aeromicrobium sp.]|uniref:choline-sulfatase n=1 Tax=Aeromicrobium sp. TaxID=1871063 RepID=UPI0039E68F7D